MGYCLDIIGKNKLFNISSGAELKRNYAAI
jgi:hypothetical protein